ncbi:DUF2809 domain-containing protein [Desnuesiella massiliensis]|uniref:ribosomal maturation YjgA family protein n=1 Tax=Desnuesiella massiliensis TaxID=1650662 RepID=UPI0006E452B5|nr:DUF2809 domain-containing protein [Desnuesiella massiliensis]
MLLGLGSRRFSYILPNFISSFSGDILWALMMFWIFGFIFNSFRTRNVALLALTFSFTIEISQLYHSPWIDNIRRTTLGGLVLGYGFLWSDLVCYSIGVLMGVFIEKLLIHSKV